MVDLKKKKKTKAKKLRILIKRWTRAEVMARLGHSPGLEFTEYAQMEVELRDKIRELLYGTSSLVELGERWGLLKKGKKKRGG